MTIARYASSGAAPPSISAWLRRPGAERPGRGRHVTRDVVPGEGRRSGACPGRSGVSAACSMARNGPTSLPVGETTPIAPARMSSGTQLVNANTTPATIIRTAPATSTRRRPSRSALVVSHSEMIVSPMSVKVRTSPTAAGPARPPPGTGRGRPRGTHSRTSGASASRTAAGRRGRARAGSRRVRDRAEGRSRRGV